MQKFEANFGLKCVEVTGDTSVSLNEMADADVILSTPEKWDSGAHFLKMIVPALVASRVTHTSSSVQEVERNRNTKFRVRHPASDGRRDPLHRGRRARRDTGGYGCENEVDLSLEEADPGR